MIDQQHLKRILFLDEQQKQRITYNYPECLTRCIPDRRDFFVKCRRNDSLNCGNIDISTFYHLCQLSQNEGNTLKLCCFYGLTDRSQYVDYLRVAADLYALNGESEERNIAADKEFLDGIYRKIGTILRRRDFIDTSDEVEEACHEIREIIRSLASFNPDTFIT